MSKEMNCIIKENGKECGKPITYNKEEKKAFNLDGSPHIHEKKPYPKNWSKKAFNDTTNLQYDAVLKELALVKDDVESLKEAVRALVAEVSFKKGTDKSLESS